MASGSVLLALVAFWYWPIYREEAARAAFLERIATLEPEQRITEPAQVPTTDGLLLLARTLETEMFPPQLDRARDTLEVALQREPFRSEIWMRLGRVQLFSGNRPQAVAALNFSDRLDPHFPRQRTEAIVLWTVLGERARADEIAVQVASLGSEPLYETTRALVRAGRTPAEIFTLLDLQNRPRNQALEAIRRMNNRNLAQQAALFALLPVEWFAEEETRAFFARMALNPLNPEWAERFWEHRDSPRRRVALGQRGREVTLENGDLEVSPFAEAFPLGWLAAPTSNDMQASWFANRGRRAGAIEVRYGNTRNNRPDTVWPFYAFILPPGEAVEAIVHVNSTPAGSGSLALSARAGQRETRSPESAGLEEGFFPLAVVVRAADEPRLVTLSLRRRHRAAGDFRPASVLIDRLELRQPVSVEEPR